MGKAEKKIKRVRDTIYFNDPDMAPIGDIFFWSEFIDNWREHFKLDDSVDIFKYYDLDIVLCSPNIDPIIDNVTEVKKSNDHVVYKGGF